MESKSEILNKLKTISPLLASIDKKNVFKTPDGYFEILDKRITANVLLNDLKTSRTQEVPEGYFELLTSKIISKIKNMDSGEEIQDISPVLFSLRDKGTFAVPPGYFENLSSSVFKKIDNGKAKVISIHGSKKWWRYAAAAAVAFLVIIGSLEFFNNKKATDDNTKMASVSANLPDYIKLSFQYETPEQFENGIASLNDTDIIAYLEQHGNVLDDEQINNGIDVDELPDAVDYLLNDNTLNDFLKMTNAQAKKE
ncbi:MAG TPA: hypothetical protein VIJ75_04010 [Hanamia sp.]